MKAVICPESLPVADPRALLDSDLPNPIARGRDLLVRVVAVSVNPVDTKVRRGVFGAVGESRILGWDAAGVVEAVGEQVSLFHPGDEVWYAGAINRPGTNAEFHLVDERVVAHKPKSLDFPEAAALPLTTITAWELLFDRLGLSAESTGTLLITGAAGGVGSMLIQLAKTRTRLRVIATASRPETREWVTSLGADQVIDHHQPMPAQLKEAGITAVEHVASLTHTTEHLADIVELIAPQGSMGVIDAPEILDINPFKMKSVAVHWESMFTRSLFETEDMIEQHRLLTEVAGMIDRQKLKSTLARHFGKITAGNLLRAHGLLESGKSRGKIVLSGF